MNRVEKIVKLKGQVQLLGERLQRAEGERNALNKKLKSDWECADLKAAKLLLGKMKAEVSDLKKSFDADLMAFEEKWAEDLDSLVD